MKNYILTNPAFTLYLILGSLLLGTLSITLAVYDIIQTGGLVSQLIGNISGAMLLAAIVLRLYQAKLNGNLSSLLIKLGFGAAIVIAMVLTGVIHAPSFFQ